MMNELTHAAGRPFAKHCAQFFHAGQQMFMRHVLDEQQLFGVREQRAFIGENNVHAHSPFLQRFAHWPKMPGDGASFFCAGMGSPNRLRAMLRILVT